MHPYLGPVSRLVPLWWLQALPLNLGAVGTAAAAAGGEPRTWMLPLLRRHVRGSEIGFWGKELLPLARTLAARR